MSHRWHVGPLEFWDILGAQMLQVMVDQGLRKEHTLLDVGCGSLRGGRFLIQYLEPGNYYGIEPNFYLVKQAITKEIGNDMVHIKRPTFSNDDSFDLSAFGIRFDYILAQSIISHTSVAQTKKLLSQMCRTIKGTAVFTYFEGDEDTAEDEWSGKTFWREETLRMMCCGVGFHKLDYPHPAGQTWVRIVRRS